MLSRHQEPCATQYGFNGTVAAAVQGTWWLQLNMFFVPFKEKRKKNILMIYIDGNLVELIISSSTLYSDVCDSNLLHNLHSRKRPLSVGPPLPALLAADLPLDPDHAGRDEFILSSSDDATFVATAEGGARRCGELGGY